MTNFNNKTRHRPLFSPKCETKLCNFKIIKNRNLKSAMTFTTTQVKHREKKIIIAFGNNHVDIKKIDQQIKKSF